MAAPHGLCDEKSGLNAEEAKQPRVTPIKSWRPLVGAVKTAVLITRWRPRVPKSVPECLVMRIVRIPER